MNDATSDGSSRSFVAGSTIVLAAGLTIWLGAPPLLFDGLAQSECAEIADSTTATARWSITLPTPQWECSDAGAVVATFGWLVTNDSAATATLK